MSKFYVLLNVHLDIIVQRKSKLMHNLFLVYIVNIYMFRVCLGPSSGGKTVCIQQLVLIILVLVGLESNPTRTTDSRLKRISTNCCIHTVVPPDDGSRYARNMYSLTKYIKNKLCIKLVFLHTIISRCTVSKTLKNTLLHCYYFAVWRQYCTMIVLGVILH